MLTVPSVMLPESGGKLKPTDTTGQCPVETAVFILAEINADNGEPSGFKLGLEFVDGLDGLFSWGERVGEMSKWVEGNLWATAGSGVDADDPFDGVTRKAGLVTLFTTDEHHKRVGVGFGLFWRPILGTKGEFGTIHNEAAHQTPGLNMTSSLMRSGSSK